MMTVTHESYDVLRLRNILLFLVFLLFPVSITFLS